MRKRMIVGILVLLLAVSAVVPAFAGGDVICFEINGEIHCIRIPSLVVRFEFPDPPCTSCPYTFEGIDILTINESLSEAMGYPEEQQWLITNLAGDQGFLLDLEQGALVDLNVQTAGR